MDHSQEDQDTRAIVSLDVQVRAVRGAGREAAATYDAGGHAQYGQGVYSTLVGRLLQREESDHRRASAFLSRADDMAAADQRRVADDMPSELTEKRYHAALEAYALTHGRVLAGRSPRGGARLQDFAPSSLSPRATWRN